MIHRLSYLLKARIVNEYGYYVKLLNLFPPSFPPRSCVENLEAAKFFIDIEKRRLVDLENDRYDQEGIVLVDRTYLSCLGFEFAAQHITGLAVYKDVERLWLSFHKIEPDITVFMDVSQVELEKRIAHFRDRFLPHFYDRIFNTYLTDFFRNEATKSHQFVRVDANTESDIVQEEILAIIRRFGKLQ